jgi:hypothetical protein
MTSVIALAPLQRQSQHCNGHRKEKKKNNDGLLIHKEKKVQTRSNPSQPARHSKKPYPRAPSHSDPCTTHEAASRSLDLHAAPWWFLSSDGSSYARLDPAALSVRWDFYEWWDASIHLCFVWGFSEINADYHTCIITHSYKYIYICISYLYEHLRKTEPT